MILPPAELDVMLPKVCEALVLVSQGIVTVTLDAEKETYSHSTPSTTLQNIRAFFNELRFENHSHGGEPNRCALTCYEFRNFLY